MKYRILFILFIIINTCTAQQFTMINGHIDFLSNAPLEIIKASSEQLQGVLDKDNKTFAFKIYIKSFDGFNSPLQKVHFFENYMEVREFPLATFKGKILEEIDINRKIYRAKGILLIHGIGVERIIEVNLNIDTKQVDFSASFLVPLEDHNIDLPRIVYQKIAEEINVHVHGSLKIRE